MAGRERNRRQILIGSDSTSIPRTLFPTTLGFTRATSQSLVVSPCWPLRWISAYFSSCMHSNDIIPTPLTNLPVSRDAMMMLESSDPLITIELSRADVTQLTGAVWSLGRREGRTEADWEQCIAWSEVNRSYFIPFPYRILCLTVKFLVSHTMTLVSSEPVIKYGDLGGTTMQVTGPLCPECDRWRVICINLLTFDTEGTSCLWPSIPVTQHRYYVFFHPQTDSHLIKIELPPCGGCSSN